MLEGCCSGVFSHVWVLLQLILIGTDAKRVHKRSARTAYRRMISMLLGIPYQNCSSLLSITSGPWIDRYYSFTACFLDTAQLQLFTSFAAMIVRTTS